jgi:hypothetical protein
MIGLAVEGIWFLFFWQKPTDTSGALFDLVVQFYRPVLWTILVVVTVVLLAPVFALIFRRTR